MGIVKSIYSLSWLIFGWMAIIPLQSSAQTDTIFRSFSAAQVEEGVLINFTIFKGITCTGVQIERSTDNVNFISIYEFAGVCGTINTEESYSFLDENPISNMFSYYRLDLGSIGLYSETLEVKFINYTVNGVTVFPNPCSNNCTIYFSNPNKSEFQLMFFDRMGKLVLDEITTADRWESGSKQISPGIYFFQIYNDGNEKHSGKLVVF